MQPTKPKNAVLSVSSPRGCCNMMASSDHMWQTDVWKIKATLELVIQTDESISKYDKMFLT